MRTRAGRGASVPDGFFLRHPARGYGLHGAARVTIGSQTNMPGSASADAAVIYVCITCRRASDPEAEPRHSASTDARERALGAILAEATARAAAGTGVVVRPIRCLANCTRGPS